MRPNKKIPIWENKHRIKVLSRYRELVQSYFSHTGLSESGESVIEQDEAKAARVQINKLMTNVSFFILFAGWRTEVVRQRAGQAERIDVITNIFNLHMRDMGKDEIIDFTDRAIGVYESDQISSWLRTFNPLYWIGQIFEYIANLPFRILGKVGFDSKKIENSRWGVLIKTIVYLLEATVAVITIYKFISAGGVIVSG